MTQDIIDLFNSSWADAKQETMSISEYLDLCKRDCMAYATPAERMVQAIGEPVKIDTANDPRLGRIFLNRTIKVYPAFQDFFGMEDTIERIVGYFTHAAQGLEERKQILYLLGPVGGGKSSLAERLKELMESFPIYALAVGDEISPVFESPLGLFSNKRYHAALADQYSIDKRYLNTIPSPWAIKRLKQFNGDITQFSVVKLMPSKLEQIAVVKTEPGDENNQDISSLVGKTDIRMLEKFSQNDPDAYSFSGSLCRGNQGIMEFVEMFKCVEKGTKISLYDGTVKNIEDIVVGDKVVALNEDTLKITSDTVTKVWETKKKEVYHLTTKRGVEFRAAGTHPVFTNNGWKQLKDINKGDFIADVRIENFGTNTFDESKIKLLGYLLGDGYIKKNRYSFINDDPDIIEDFIQCLDNIGLRHTTRSKNYDPATMVRDIRINDGLHTKHTDLVEEYKLFGIHGNGSKEKTIPNFIFGLSKPLVALFLNRLFSTDGTISPIKNTNRYSVSYRTSSKKMAQSLSQLLLKFGIVARITKHESYHTNTGERVYTGTSYNINFSNNEFLKIFANEIGIFGKKNLRIQELKTITEIEIKTSGNHNDAIPKNLILESVDIEKLPKKRINEKYWLLQKTNKKTIRSLAQGCAEMFCDDGLRRIAYSDVYWDQVKSIHNTNEYAEMYDIQVENNHNYIANGIVSHNSPIKVLHPLLTATQEGNYIGTEAISAIPFNGIVLAHSNESEWQSFKSNRNNEAFLDRICVIKVPYCLRVSEEQSIYEKMMESSDLRTAPCAPETYKLLSRFCVLTRLVTHENSNLYSKLRVYDGENIKETDPRAKSLQEYKDASGQDEGMSGISTRFAFKILSNTFNHDPDEVAADPVHLMLVLENAIRREQFSQETEDRYLGFIKDYLIKEYAEFIGNEIQQNYLESYDDYGQNLFDRYLMWADHWMQEIDYKDPDTGQLFDREVLNTELEKIEKPAGIANPKDFRNEVVGFALRQSARSGKPVAWTSYEKLRKVIEKKMFSSTEDLLPIISFGAKSSKEDQKKHDDFVNRMVKRGYTPRQTKRLVEWYMRVSKAG